MHIKIEPYDPDWALQFESIKQELSVLLKDFHPEIEHFGSTSVPGLSAKPVIDVLVGIQDVAQFEALVEKFSANRKYIYYEVFNADLPERRLFVRLKDEVNTEAFDNVYSQLEGIPHDKINESRIAHVHVWEFESPDWIRHIAFREYLKAHEDVRLVYENLKKQLSQKDWEHGMAYNDGKDAFLKTEEKKAILWYLKMRLKQPNPPDPAS